MSLAGTAHADDVKIGYAGPMTGAQAHYGRICRTGSRSRSRISTRRFPKIGGKPVKFVLDTQDD